MQEKLIFDTAFTSREQNQKTTNINGEDLIRHMRGRGTVNLSTDEIMALTRGDD